MGVVFDSNDTRLFGFDIHIFLCIYGGFLGRDEWLGGWKVTRIIRVCGFHIQCYITACEGRLETIWWQMMDVSFLEKVLYVFILRFLGSLDFSYVVLRRKRMECEEKSMLVYIIFLGLDSTMKERTFDDERGSMCWTR